RGNRGPDPAECRAGASVRAWGESRAEARGRARAARLRSGARGDLSSIVPDTATKAPPCRVPAAGGCGRSPARLSPPALTLPPPLDAWHPKRRQSAQADFAPL